MDNTEKTQSGNTAAKTDDKSATGNADKNNTAQQTQSGGDKSAAQSGKSGGANLGGGTPGAGSGTGGGGGGGVNSGGSQTSAAGTPSIGSVGDATGAIKDALGQAKETGGAVASKAYGIAAQKATEAIDEHKTNLTQGLTSVADTIRQIGGNLSGAQEPTGVANIAAQYTNTAAEKVEQISGYLDRRDFKGLVRDLEDAAHKNPALFLGGAFALGILAARFFKSGNSDNAITRRRRRLYGAENSGDDIGGGTARDIGGGLQVRQLRRKSGGGGGDKNDMENTGDAANMNNRSRNMGG